MLDIGLGKMGEILAAQLLLDQKFDIVAENYRCLIGEIDLVATKNRVLYVIEVKTRSSTKFGRPAEAVTPTKQRKLRRLALYYTAEKNYSGAISFGVIEVLFSSNDGSPEINFIKEAF